MTHLWEERLPRGATNANQDRFDRDGNVKVSISDQWTDLVDVMLNIPLGSVTIATTVTPDTNTVTLDPGHGTVAGEYLCFRENEPVIINNDPSDIASIGRIQQSEVLLVVGDVITVDTPFEYAFTPEATVCRQNINLNATGTPGAPIYASIRPLAPTKWDITRVIIFIEGDVAMTDALFGSIGKLDNGVVLRKKNDDIHTIFNFKDNGELRRRNFDLDYGDPSRGGPGVYTVTSRRTFNGQSKNGVTIRLDGSFDDELQIVIQDDLSTVVDFRIIAQGHVVDTY